MNLFCFPHKILDMRDIQINHDLVFYISFNFINPGNAEPGSDMPSLCKHCRSRSVGFWKPTDLDLHCLSLSIRICHAEHGYAGSRAFANSVDPHQLASGLISLSLSIRICINNLDQVI